MAPKPKLLATATDAVIAGVGAFAGGQLSGMANFIPQDLHGAVFTALGIAGQAYVKNPQVKKFCEGVSTYGVLRLATQVTRRPVPGLSGLDSSVGYVELDGVVDGLVYDEPGFDLGYVESGNVFSDLSGVNRLDEVADAAEIAALEFEQEIGEVDTDIGYVEGDEIGEVEEGEAVGAMDIAAMDREYLAGIDQEQEY